VCADVCMCVCMDGWMGVWMRLNALFDISLMDGLKQAT